MNNDTNNNLFSNLKNPKHNEENTTSNLQTNNNPFDDWGFPSNQDNQNQQTNTELMQTTNTLANNNNNIESNNLSVRSNNILKNNEIERTQVTIENNVSNNQIELNNNYEDKKGLVPLILSIINIVCAPGVVGILGGFLMLLIIFGGATGDFSNADMYLFIGVIVFYIIFSLFFLFISYINFFKRSKTKKRKYILIVVGIIILFILYIDIAPIYRIVLSRLH